METPRRRVLPGTEKGAKGFHAYGAEDRHAPKPAEADTPASLEFMHNYRLLVLFIPCSIMVLASAGSVALAIVAVGAVLSYVANSIGIREFGFVLTWISIIACMIAISVVDLYSHHSPLLKLLLSMLFNTYLVLVGLWLSLLSEFFQTEVPELLGIVERVIFSCLCMPSTVILMLALIPLFGIDASPYYLCFVMLGTLKVCIPPLGSSYSSTTRLKIKGNAELEVVCGATVSAFHMVSYHLLPATLYVSLHYRTAFSTGIGFANMAILSCLPAFLAQAVLEPRSFWWTGYTEHEISAMRPFLLGVTVIVATAAIEYRVVLHGFSSYLYYHSSAPLISHLLVTLAMYAAAGSGFLVCHGLDLKDQGVAGRESLKMRFNAFRVCVHVFALATTLAVGVPFYLLPLVVAGSHTALEFWTTRSFPLYVFFVIAFSIFLWWFMHRSFWFLEVSFGQRLSLRATSVLIGIVDIAILFLPGLFVLRADLHVFIGLGLLAHAAGLCVVECVLYNQNNQYETAVYPTYMVFFTSAVGIALAHALRQRGHLAKATSWLLLTVHISKLGILLTDSVRDLIDCGLLTAAVTSTFLLYSPSRKMTRNNTIFHIIAITLTWFTTRNTVIYHLLSSIKTRAPNSDEVLSAFFLLAALTSTTVTFGHTHDVYWRKVNSVAVILAVIFVVLQPDTGLLIRDEVILPDAPPRWPAWVLFTGLTVLLLSVTSAVPVPRVLLVCTVGTCIGLYTCGMYLQQHLLIRLLFILIFNIVALLLMSLFYPNASTNKYISIVYGVFIALLPCTYMAIVQIYGSSPQKRGDDLLFSTRLALLGVYASLNFLVALCVKLGNEMSLKREQRGGKVGRKSERTRYGVPIYVGNVASILALSLGSIIHTQYQGGNENCILFLAPILLLLNQDDGMFSKLTEERRYAPLFLASCIFLTGYSVWKMDFAVASSSSILKNLICLICTLPSQSKLSNFLWAMSKLNHFELIVVAPLNLIAIVIADISALRLLGMLGVVGAAMAIWTSHNIRQQGLRVL